eukprot:3747576-Alexandrium_andersonii.AAC.1
MPPALLLHLEHPPATPLPAQVHLAPGVLEEGNRARPGGLEDDQVVVALGNDDIAHVDPGGAPPVGGSPAFREVGHHEELPD